MKREGRQHGMVRTYSFMSAPWNPRPNRGNLNELISPPTAGLFTKVSTKPTNHSKFTGKCGRPMCRGCHDHPACKSKDKVKGAHKIKSSSHVGPDYNLVTWRVVNARPGLKFSGLSATGALDYLAGDDYVDRDYEDDYDEDDGVEIEQSYYHQIEEHSYITKVNRYYEVWSAPQLPERPTIRLLYVDLVDAFNNDGCDLSVRKFSAAILINVGAVRLNNVGTPSSLSKSITKKKKIYIRIKGVVEFSSSGVVVRGFGMGSICVLVHKFPTHSVVGLNFDFVVLNLTKHSSYLIYNASLFFSSTVQRQYREKFGLNEMIPVAANDVAFSIHAVLLTTFTLFQIAIYDRGNQKVSKASLGIVSVAWLSIAVCVVVAIPRHSWFWLISCFNTVQAVMTIIKYIPQVSIFFDILFMVQHYVLYRPKKTVNSSNPSGLDVNIVLLLGQSEAHTWQRGKQPAHGGRSAFNSPNEEPLILGLTALVHRMADGTRVASSVKELRHGPTGETSHGVGAMEKPEEEPRMARRQPHCGEDLRGWIYKCEQFFEIDNTPPEAKVRIAVVHLEGKALQWHQIFMKNRLTRELPHWGEYVRALNDRFGALLYEDPMSELVNLKQNGSIREYLDKFDELMNCVELPEPYAISCFLGGLKSDVVVHVRMFKPRTLQDDISLAKLQEHANSLNAKKQPNPMPTLNEKEVKEGGTEDVEEINETDKVVEDEKGEKQSGNCHVSMNAMTGIHDFRTMKVLGSSKVVSDIRFNSTTDDEGTLMQLEPSLGNSTGNLALDTLLFDFADLFEVPTSLPPHRLYDHAITLKGGTDAVNVKPYRYPAIQKNEIEKIVQEMLDNGVLDRRLAQKDHHAVTQVLVKWFNAPMEDSTWENLYELQ
ncbi:hypothetical protein BUALT_Bualt04G0167500 [Buddleja alternifolia]|uniref:Chromo domain-containing protein n=1 Tax=Buddleja alternifolia TaxID=168488 RepID=A0AAV6XW28_9LAMI|nr:hypothetical protein BUALT_Bualt04G0167500 [Buddleja alternifolia]